MCSSDLASILRSDKAVSLLPVGAVSADGDWEEGDIVTLLTEAGETIGYGRAAVSGADAKKMAGRRGGRPLVHYDYLFIE